MSNTANTTSSGDQKLMVSLGERSYPIFVGDVGFSDPAKLTNGIAPFIRGNQVAVITNETIAPLYLQQVLTALGNRQVDVFQMQDGERYKSLDTYTQVMDFLLEKKHNRSTCLIALGGGVVGDLCGFVAATFQRESCAMSRLLSKKTRCVFCALPASPHDSIRSAFALPPKPMKLCATLSTVENLPASSANAYGKNSPRR